LLGHGVLLGFGAPSQLRLLAGQEHGRTIPLADVGSRRIYLMQAVCIAISRLLPRSLGDFPEAVSSSRNRGVARQSILCREADRRVLRAKPPIAAAPLDDFEK
jgi:hypothetical protein